MEEGTKNKKTIFIGGLNEDIDQTTLISSMHLGVVLFVDSEPRIWLSSIQYFWRHY
jgi:hypothetical protein